MLRRFTSSSSTHHHQYYFHHSSSASPAAAATASSSSTTTVTNNNSCVIFSSALSFFTVTSTKYQSFSFFPVNQLTKHFTTVNPATTKINSQSKNSQTNHHQQQQEEDQTAKDDDILIEKISSTTSDFELDRLTFNLLRLIEKTKSNKQISAAEKNKQLLSIVDDQLVEVVVRNLSEFRTPQTSIRYLASIIAELTAPQKIGDDYDTDNNGQQQQQTEISSSRKARELFLNHPSHIEFILLLMLERCGNNPQCITELSRVITHLASHSAEAARRFAMESNRVAINVLNYALLKQTHLAPASSARLLYQGRGTARYCVEAVARAVSAICISDKTNASLELFLQQNTFEPIFDAFLKFETCNNVCALLALFIADNEGSEASTRLRKKLTNQQIVERITFLLHRRVLTSSDLTNVSALIVSLCHENPEAQNMFAMSHQFGRALVECFPIAFMNDTALKSLVSAITSLFGSSKDYAKTASVLVYFPRLIDLLIYSVWKSILQASAGLPTTTTIATPTSTSDETPNVQTQQEQNSEPPSAKNPDTIGGANDRHHQCSSLQKNNKLSTKTTPAVGALLHSMASLCALADGLPIFEDEHGDIHNSSDKRIIKSIKKSVFEGIQFLSKNVEDFKEIDEHIDSSWKVMKESKTGRRILFKILRNVFI